MEIKKDINNEDLPKRELSNIKLLVIHHTASDAPFSNILKYLKKTDNISTHYAVNDGEVVQLVDDDRIAYHAGVSSYPNFEPKGNSLNWCSLGIEVHSNGKDFSEAEKKTTKELITYLMKKYNIPARLVVRHADIAPKRKWDIGENFFKEYGAWEKFQSSLVPIDEKTLDGINAVIYSLKSLWHLTDSAEIKMTMSRMKDEVVKLKK